MIITVVGLLGIVCFLAALTDQRRRVESLHEVDGSFRRPERPRKRFRAPSDPEWLGDE